MVIRGLDICDILIITGDTGSQSLILRQLFVGIYNVFCGKIFTIMPFHPVTELECISIGVLIKSVVFCQFLHWFAVSIILHQPGKDQIRKFLMVVQKRIDGTF